jgi:F0F1-type ATP synthase delta subunit
MELLLSKSRDMLGQTTSLLLLFLQPSTRLLSTLVTLISHVPKQQQLFTVNLIYIHVNNNQQHCSPPIMAAVANCAAAAEAAEAAEAYVQCEPHKNDFYIQQAGFCYP